MIDFLLGLFVCLFVSVSQSASFSSFWTAITICTYKHCQYNESMLTLLTFTFAKRRIPCSISPNERRSGAFHFRGGLWLRVSVSSWVMARVWVRVTLIVMVGLGLGLVCC